MRAPIIRFFGSLGWIDLKGRVTEQMRMRPSIFTEDIPNGYSSQACMQPKPGARLVSCMGGRAHDLRLVSHFQCSSREPNQNLCMPDFNQHSKVGRNLHKCPLSLCATSPPLSTAFFIDLVLFFINVFSSCIIIC